MRSDKKARAGKLRFVFVPRIGKAISHDGIPEGLVERILHHAPYLRAASRRGHG